MTSQGESSSAIWVPVCCDRVMRHNTFRSGDTVAAATLVCASCGKSVALTPAHTLDQYGEPMQVVRVLGVAKPASHGSVAATAADVHPNAKTMT